MAYTGCCERIFSCKMQIKRYSLRRQFHNITSKSDESYSHAKTINYRIPHGECELDTITYMPHAARARACHRICMGSMELNRRIQLYLYLYALYVTYVCLHSLPAIPFVLMFRRMEMWFTFPIQQHMIYFFYLLKTQISNHFLFAYANIVRTKQKWFIKNASNHGCVPVCQNGKLFALIVRHQ